MKLSRTLDHVGVFARTLEDAALAAQQLVGYDERDPDTRPRAAVPFLRVAQDEPPLPPRLAFVRTPLWDRVEPDAQEAFGELVALLGSQCEAFELPASLREAWDWHQTIMLAEMAANLEREWDKGRDRLSAPLRERLARGREVTALEYQKALACIAILNDGFEELFASYDAVLTPAAPGTAPKGLDSTGDPSFCTLWTLCGMPALSVPLMKGENGLPLGVQLVGARHGDARLLRTARWLVSRVQAD